MKHKIYSLIVALAAVIGFSSCSDDTWKPNLDKDGSVSLATMQLDISTAESLISRASDIDLSDFIITIKQGDVVKEQWTYSQMPEIVTLPVGEYTVDVISHQVQKQDWDKPYFKGSKNFAIENGKITDIGTVVCTFASLKVTIVFTEELLERASDCQVTVVTNDEGKLVYTPADMDKAGYFEVVSASTTLVATFEGVIDGNDEVIQKTYTEVTAGTHIRITYSCGTMPDLPEIVGQISGSGITVSTEATDVNVGGNITVDEDNIDPGQRPGYEDPEDPENPENPEDPETPGVESDMTMSCPTLVFSPEKNNFADFTSGKITIYSAAGFKHLYVTIGSDNESFLESLPSVGMPLNFDLVEPGDLEETLRDSFGFPTGSDFNGKTEVLFDITDLVPLLGAFSNSEHSFTIEIVDKNDNSYTSSLIIVVD